jgi:peptidoglycan-N-acetylglucosamine deacetylase
VRLVEARHGISEPVVALTFDDGPSPWTDPIVDALERHGGRGTFFVIGDALDGEERLATLRRLHEGGHEVCNHTWSHPDLQTVDDAAIRDEMLRTSARLEELLGERPRFWRAPFFRVDERVRAAVGDLAGQEVWHSVLPGDWELEAEEIAWRVLEPLQPGDVVVLHDGRPANEPAHLSSPTREATVAAVERILAEMTARGWRSVTISELLASA